MEKTHGQYHPLAGRRCTASLRGGIDISKDTLDVHRLADGQHSQFLNGKTGFSKLLRWVGLQPTPLIIFEATGAYHRQLEQALGAKAVPFVKVNPKQARRFAQASGKLVKTDRVDCEMLAKMKLRKRLDLARDAERVAGQVPGLIVEKWREGR